MKRKVFAYPYIVWMALFIAVPMVFIFYYAFNVDGSFSFSKAWATLSDISKWRVLWVSIEIAAGTTIFCLLLGYPVAYILSNMRKSVAGFISVLFFVPMWMNFVLRTYAWQAILEYAIPNMLGWTDKTLTGSVWAVMMVLVYNFIPFMVMPRLKQSSSMLYEAALDLGCTPMQAMFRVIIPDIMPGITSGFIMALTMSLDDFVVSYFVSDLRSTLSVYMYSAARGAKGVNPALATIIFIPLVTLLLIVNLRRISKEREDEIQNKKVKMKG